MSHELKATRPLKVGIISANWGARAHLPAWRSFDGIEVAAICTSRPETAKRASQEFAIPRHYSDHRAMALDSDLDIIDIGTRPLLRREMVLAALSAGKHVYCGIPFAASLNNAREMHAAWRQSGTVGVVDAFIQVVPALIHMKELIDNGYLGEPLGVRASFDLAMFTGAGVNVPTYHWFADAENGACVVRNMGSHLLHLLVYLFARVEQLVSDERILLEEWQLDDTVLSPNVTDAASLLLRFANGMKGDVQLCWSMPEGRGFHMEAWGSHGRLEANGPGYPQAHNTQLFAGNSGAIASTMKPVALPERLLSVPGSNAPLDSGALGQLPMARLFSGMQRAILGKDHSAAPDFEQALHVQALVEASSLSARERRWVKTSEL